jgi:hypothetical protein
VAEQCVEGEPRSSGHDPSCEPLSPVLLQLAAHPHVLRLVRSLLGEDSRLHNAGLSLVTPPPEAKGETPGTTPERWLAAPGTTPERWLAAPGTTLAAHLPHQDQPVNSARVWRGRAPPPTHPLSLQALWMLDDFTWDNGAFYTLPRTQRRTEHIDSWATEAASRANASSAAAMRAAAARGLLPTRLVTGRAGDVAFALGSLWHAPSTSLPGQRPRLALLFEYAPSFVQPRDRYSPAVLRRHRLPEQLWPIFPLLQPHAHGQRPVPSYGAAESPSNAPWTSSAAFASNSSAPFASNPAAASTANAPSSGPRAVDRGCGPQDVVSVFEWYAMARERPWCVHARTRVVLRGGVTSVPVVGLGTGSPDDEPEVIAAALRGVSDDL